MRREKDIAIELKRCVKACDADESQFVSHEVHFVPSRRQPKEGTPKGPPLIGADDESESGAVPHIVPLAISCARVPQERLVAFQEAKFSAGSVHWSQHMVRLVQLHPCKGECVQDCLQLLPRCEPLLLDVFQHPWPQLRSKNTGSHHKSAGKALTCVYAECHHETLSCCLPASALRLSR